MINFPPTIIYRHRRENLKKCTLSPCEKREDFRFYTYPKDPLPYLENYIFLTFDAPVLTIEDRDQGLFILDATWRYAHKMEKFLPPSMCFIKRSLPSMLKTAYPRYQSDCEFPGRGLASIEALAVAYKLMGRKYDNLLENYYWKDDFFNKNNDFFLA